MNLRRRILMPIMEQPRKNDYLDKLSDNEIDMLIDNLCSARENNPDVMIMDQIHKGEMPLTEKESDAMALNAVTEEIISNVASSGIPLSIEEVNSYKAAGIYNKYLDKLYNNNKEEDIMDSIEEELKRGLEESSNNNIPEEEAIEEVVSEDASFQTSDETNTDTVEDETSIDAEEVITDVDIVSPGDGASFADITSEDIKEGMSIEEFNDVPATNLSVDNETLTKAIKESNEEATEEEALQFINVINRYKSGEKFSVFEALPESMKKAIEKEADACGADRSMMEFFAKSYINDLVNNTFLDEEIKDFNKELKAALAPMQDIVGTVMSEYTDELNLTFTNTLEEKADAIQDTNPEKANQLRTISSTFKDAIVFKRVTDLIDATPSVINKAYKYARDNGNDFIDKYNKAIVKMHPSPKDLECFKIGLSCDKIKNVYDYTYIDALIVLIGNTVISAIESGTLEEQIYAYYTTNAIFTLGLTRDNSDSGKLTMDAAISILEKIKKYMIPLESRNTRKNRKRNRR